MIKLSVGLPFFRSKYIGWLALESLCLQRDIDFEWELFVVEDGNREVLGEEKVLSYKNRLESVGCVNFKYLYLNKRLYLGEKLKYLISLFSESEVAIWNPDDYFAPCNLLSNAYKYLKDDSYDWYSIPKTVFYNISNEKTFVYDVLLNKNGRRDDTTGRAFKTVLLKEAAKKFTNVRSGCDGMLSKKYKEVLGRPANFYFDSSDIWRCGLNTKGLNNISVWQDKWFNNLKEGTRFYEYKFDLKETIPEYILNNLKECEKFINKHHKGLN